MSDIHLTLKKSQCNLIALALDLMINSGNLNGQDKEELEKLFLQFDTISEPLHLEMPKDKKKLRLVYDRDSNIHPLFPK